MKLFNRSVFKPLPKGSSMESTLAVYFHRLSATLYFIYSAWAVLAVFTGIPSLVEANGDQWQVIFSMATLLFTAPAWFGATFWPSYARLEMFAGTLFAALMLVYVAVLVGNVFFGEGSWAGIVIISSVGAMPIFRNIIVSKLLVEQAEERKQRAQRAEAGE